MAVRKGCDHFTFPAAKEAMSSDQISGFMLGLSVGVIVGLLMPPNHIGLTTTVSSGDAHLDPNRPAKRMPASQESRSEDGKHPAPIGARFDSV